MGLSIVILSKNVANLAPCILAIREARETARIFVVDDGVDFNDWECAGLVTDDLDRLGVERIEGVKPFIFARNVNLGIRAAGDDDVILLNDDALLQTPDGFSAMQRAAKVDSGRYGVISAVTNLAGNPAQHPQNSPVGAIRNEPRTVAFVCVLISRLVIKSVGLLDERFTAYGWEDNDYCRRVRNAGGRIGIFDGCFVDHGSLHSTFRGNPRAAGDTAPGAEIYRSKWGDLS